MLHDIGRIEKIVDNTFPLTGNVQKVLRDRSGNVVNKHSNHNLVLQVGRSVLAQLLIGSLNTKITMCAIGDGGVPSNDPFTPIEPKVSDTRLISEKFRKNIDSFSLMGDDPQTTVVFTTLFRSDEADCIASEVGLFFEDGTIFARHTFPAMYLKSDRGYSLEIEWQINL